MYPRWIWRAFALPGVVWLVVFFVVAFYAIVATSFGFVDDAGDPIPMFNPLHWNVGWFNAGVSQGGDGGDDNVYAKVLLNQGNRITMQVTCSRSMPMGNVATTIRPNRNGQTFWFGYPAGVASN